MNLAGFMPESERVRELRTTKKWQVWVWE